MTQVGYEVIVTGVGNLKRNSKMALRNLTAGEFIGWANKTLILRACEAALVGEATPAPVKALCQTVIDAAGDCRSGVITVIYPTDVTAIGQGLLASGLVTQDQYDSLVAMLEVPDVAEMTAADAILAREDEVKHYQINIDNYTEILDEFADLPASWPEALVQYRGLTVAQIQMLDVDDDTFTTVSRLQHRDRIRSLLRSEKAEQAKSVTVLNALKNRIPAERLDAALAAARQRRN